MRKQRPFNCRIEWKSKTTKLIRNKSFVAWAYASHLEIIDAGICDRLIISVLLECLIWSFLRTQLCIVLKEIFFWRQNSVVNDWWQRVREGIKLLMLPYRVSIMTLKNMRSAIREEMLIQSKRALPTAEISVRKRNQRNMEWFPCMWDIQREMSSRCSTMKRLQNSKSHSSRDQFDYGIGIVTNMAWNEIRSWVLSIQYNKNWNAGTEQNTNCIPVSERPSSFVGMN